MASNSIGRASHGDDEPRGMVEELPIGAKLGGRSPSGGARELVSRPVSSSAAVATAVLDCGRCCSRALSASTALGIRSRLGGRRPCITGVISRPPSATLAPIVVERRFIRAERLTRVDVEADADALLALVLEPTRPTRVMTLEPPSRRLLAGLVRFCLGIEEPLACG